MLWPPFALDYPDPNPRSALASYVLSIVIDHVVVVVGIVSFSVCSSVVSTATSLFFFINSSENFASKFSKCFQTAERSSLGAANAPGMKIKKIEKAENIFVLTQLQSTESKLKRVNLNKKPNSLWENHFCGHLFTMPR